MSYKLNNWYVSNIKYLTPQPGVAPEAGRTYFTFDIPDLSEEPYSNLTNATEITTSAIGNSLEALAAFYGDADNYFTLYIDDGTNRAGINIYEGSIVTLDGEHTLVVGNAPESGDDNLHRYTLTLQNGLFTVFFDTNRILTYTVTENSVKQEFGAGFFESQNGFGIINFKYLKQAKGVYQYIKPEEVDFELQIDSSSKFDSINLHSYTKSSFTNVPAIKNAWDPVSFTAGTYNKDTNSYDYKGLIQAVSIHLPTRQDRTDYNFYYRVRFIGTEYTSDWSQVYLTSRVDPIDIEIIDNTDNRKIAYNIDEFGPAYLTLNPLEDNLGVLLPLVPTTDGLSFTIYNKSDYTLNVFSVYGDSTEESGESGDTDYRYYNPFTIEGKSIVRIYYSETDNKWYKSTISTKKTFILPQNIQNAVFDCVFNYHIPAYDYVYTKDFNSGNVADFVLANATGIDMMFNDLYNRKVDLDSFSADRDLFNSRWSNVFSLDTSLFKNSAEQRDAFMCITNSLPGQMIRKPIKDLIYELTGANPVISEYKDLTFNVLWSETDLKLLPSNKKYYLYDENHPSYEQNLFVLYSGAAKAFTWQIDVFDPYNLKYNQELIKQVIDMYKPAHTYVIVNFYDYEGVPYTKRYFYGTDNYIESLYNI